MNEFLHRITTSLNWFIGFVIFVVLFFLFMWRLVDPNGYSEAVNGFMHDMWEIAKFLIALAVIAIGAKIMLFGGRKK